MHLQEMFILPSYWFIPFIQTEHVLWQYLIYFPNLDYLLSYTQSFITPFSSQKFDLPLALFERFSFELSFESDLITLTSTIEYSRGNLRVEVYCILLQICKQIYRNLHCWILTDRKTRKVLQSTVSFRNDPSIPKSSSVVFGLPWRFDSSATYFCCWSKKSRLSSTFFFQKSFLIKKNKVFA